ncbi:LEA_2 domain-containing protein [Cephalotus follicularis]|uniref:LEA_2 domain-containing protein n=1 Tax=Cephalotus follicularis TaxID=3775 RepID=A0A1Q3D4J7_CEPFO|nr:LEA_2 domain-containing protein [Cephalotus follicularis]
MEEGEPAMIPVLQKPPGYSDPTVPVQPRRKPVLPPSFQPKVKRKSWCRIFCCCLCIALSIFILLLVVSSGLFYLWFDPKLPVYHLQSVRIPTFNVTVKPDGTFVDARTVTRLQMKNPNGKLTYYYSGVRLGVTVDDGTDLGSVRIAGFTQGRRNTTTLKAETKVDEQLVDDGMVVSRLKARYRTKALVVHVAFRTRIRLGLVGVKLKLGSVSINVFCGGVSLKRLERGHMHKCTVNMLRWINI